MSIRMIVAIDVEVDTVKEAIAELSRVLDANGENLDGWEYTDEWYDGTRLGSPNELVDAYRELMMGNETKQRPTPPKHDRTQRQIDFRVQYYNGLINAKDISFKYRDKIITGNDYLDLPKAERNLCRPVGAVSSLKKAHTDDFDITFVQYGESHPENSDEYDLTDDEEE